MSAPLLQAGSVRTLALRGLRSYVESPSAYVALLAFYLLAGYLFALQLFLNGQASLRGMTESVPLLLTIVVPGLTMGLLSEELKSGTFETLATLPLEDWDIVLGKYLGFAGLHAAAVAGLLFYPALLSFMVQPPAALDRGEVLGILTGFGLLGFMYGAIGLFASSLSKSQIVALITAFLLCFAFFIVGKIAIFLPGAAGGLAAFVGTDSHLENLGKGVLDTRDLLYFLSVIFGFLYLTVARLSARRF